MPWPSDITPIPVDNFTDDSDTVTGVGGAREDLEAMLAKFNTMLASIAQGAVPTTSDNDGAYMKQLGVTQDFIITTTNQGLPQSSGKKFTVTVTNSDAEVPTCQGVREYVADNSGLAASNTVSWALDTSGFNTIAHTLGTYPDFISSWLQCTTTDGGYTAGDRIYFGGSMTSPYDGNAPAASITVYADATSLYIANQADIAPVIGAQDVYIVSSHDGTSVQTLDADDWIIYARAYKL